jgi:peptidyl-Lys metalloendopeptidase
MDLRILGKAQSSAEQGFSLNIIPSGFSKPLVLQIVFLIAWLVSFGVQAQANSLRVELKVLDPSRLEISYSLRNDSKQDVRVLTWNTPLEEAFNGDNFDVSFDGKKEMIPAPYRERHVKRSAAAAEDYILLRAGDSTSVELDISYGYLTERAGFYTIQYDALIEYYAIPQGIDADEYQLIESDRVQMALQSNTVAAYQSLSFAAIDAKLPPEFGSCDANQQSEIDVALTAAEVMALSAAEALNLTTVGQRPAAARYTTWFGSYLSSRYTTVSTNFNAIQDAIVNRQLKFSCGSARCGRTTFAFVYGDSPYEVFLCPQFWNAELTGTDSRAGTIIHELSHFTILGGTDDHQYGQSSAKQLGVTDPNRAISNADSHEFFAENTPVLSMGLGTVSPGGTEPEPEPTSETLAIGSPLTGNLEAGKWRYFEVTGASEVSLFNLSADLDLYIGNGARPTESNYQCRPFFGETGTETCSVSPEATTFVGITGTIAGSFSLVANAAVISGGSADSGSSANEAATLSADIPVSGSVEMEGWTYFQVTGAAEVTLYNLSTDLDLYIGNGANPTASDYLCRPFSSGTSSEICGISDISGTTFIGVNAYAAGSSFSILASTESAAPSTSAAQMLAVNSAVTGSLGQGEWDYYEVSGANQIRLFDLSADLDIYVSQTTTPTAEQYDCRPFSSETTEEICSLNPEGVSYIGVNAYGGGNYSLIATAEAQSGDISNQMLNLGEPVTGSLSAGDWAYYEVLNATEISLYGLTADLDLYVSSSGQPSETNYTCRPFIAGDNVENCSITARGTVTIGVKAFDSGTYSLVATNSAASNIGEAVVMEANQETYVAGDPLLITMTIKGDVNLDTYASIVLPGAEVYYLSPQGAISNSNDEVILFHNTLQVDGEQTHTVLNITLPSGLPSGVWQACGLLVRSGQTLAEENWLGLNCTSFMVNPGSGKVSFKPEKVLLKKG